MTESTIAAERNESARPRIDQLANIQLDEARESVRNAAIATALGPEHWRRRKLEATRETLALSMVAPRDRFMVLALDATEELRLQALMRCPVSCFAQGEESTQTPLDDRPAQQPTIADSALLMVRYPQQVMMSDLPGTSFVRILQPRGVWHPNADRASGVLCLGLTLPRNIPLREIIWLTYTALTMQSFMFDERDHAGVLNVDAARWWAANRDRLPLTATGLLEDRPL